jgi:hypothetical protein
MSESRPSFLFLYFTFSLPLVASSNPPLLRQVRKSRRQGKQIRTTDLSALYRYDYAPLPFHQRLSSRLGAGRRISYEATRCSSRYRRTRPRYPRSTKHRDPFKGADRTVTSSHLTTKMARIRKQRRFSLLDSSNLAPIEFPRQYSA